MRLVPFAGRQRRQYAIVCDAFRRKVMIAERATVGDAGTSVRAFVAVRDANCVARCRAEVTVAGKDSVETGSCEGQEWDLGRLG
jgi:hypothetical protein